MHNTLAMPQANRHTSVDIMKVILQKETEIARCIISIKVKKMYISANVLFIMSEMYVNI